MLLYILNWVFLEKSVPAYVILLSWTSSKNLACIKLWGRRRRSWKIKAECKWARKEKRQIVAKKFKDAGVDVAIIKKATGLSGSVI